MKIKVNEEACIGCGACFAAAEEIFEMTDAGLSHVKVDVVPEDKKEKAINAMEGCPTSAIVEEKD